MAIGEPFPDWYHADNQFPSRERMDEVHIPVLAAVLHALDAHGRDVLDMGCGNGALLRKIVEARPDVVPWGVDRDPGKIAHAALLLPGFAGNLVAADLFDGDLPFGERRFALGLLAARRFEEAGPERAAALRRWIRVHCDALLVYGYGLAIREPDSLVRLCRRVGIRLADESDGVRAGLAIRY